MVSPIPVFFRLLRFSWSSIIIDILVSSNDNDDDDDDDMDNTLINDESVCM